ncbi:hypothetical protein MLD55_12300 [Alcanivorax sp. MM125-6]|nr:hypothetical protein [Alcanivorax sp. MM125-6]
MHDISELKGHAMRILQTVSLWGCCCFAGLGLAACGGSDGSDGGVGVGNPSDPGTTPAEQVAYFPAMNGMDGVELWRSDGTEAGTAMVADINPNGDSDPREITRFDGRVYFSADDDTGREVWYSDGTAAGTDILFDVNLNGGSDARLLRVSGDALYFMANEPTTGYEPYVSDGTPGGTMLLRDIRDGGSSGNGIVIGRAGGRTIMRADDGTTGAEPWVTDGTRDGTRLLKDIFVADPDDIAGSDGLVGVPVTAMLDDILYFVAQDRDHGAELWRTDGTSEGTRLVADVVPGTDGIGTLVGMVSRAGDLIYFEVRTSSSRELWVSDGTEAGTELVRDIQVVGRRSIAFNGQLFFAGFDGQQTELWKSDGTAAGTVMVSDINPGTSNGSDPAFSGFAVYEGALYFAADDGNGNVELWKTDGSEAGTVKVAEINPTGAALPSGLQVIGNGLLFAADDGVSGCEPWLTDGTEAGTRQVADINVGAADGVPGCID